MNKYTVTSNGTTPFILTKGSEILGFLSYPTAYNTTKGEIKLQSETDSRSIKTTGFWKNNISLWEDTKCVYEATLGWNLQVACTIHDQQYILKVESLPKGLFVLKNKLQEDVLQIEVAMNWIAGSAAYSIQTLKNEDSITDVAILFVVHTCNYFLALRGNSGSVEGMLAATV